MRRRWIIGALAAVLALLGTFLIVNYVSGADARAMANQQPSQVLVVKRDVPMGTAVRDLAPFVETRSLPKAAVVDGAITDLQTLPQTNVASTVLKVGEQLLAARFVDPNSDEVTAQVALPKGMQQLSIQLEPQRVVGAKLKAGDLIGIYMSMTVKDTTSPNSEAVSTTNVIAHKVLVLRAQGSVPQSVTTPSASTGEKAPSTSVIVTVAVDSALAQRIIFSQEFGKIWLTQEKDDSTTTGTKPINAGNVYAA